MTPEEAQNSLINDSISVGSKFFSWTALVTPEEAQNSLINDSISVGPKARA